MLRTPDCFSVAETCRRLPESSSEARLSAYDVCAGHAQRLELIASEAGLFWLEEPAGHHGKVLMVCSEADDCRRLLETGALGSHLNGYGGGSLAALDDRVVVVSDRQRLISVNPDDAVAKVLVDEPECEWGGLAADPARNRVLAVREARGAQQLVAVGDNGDWQCLHEGEDFYGAPALSPDGWRVAWISWQLPDMPWHQSKLWIGELDRAGNVRNLRCCVPPAEGSIQQPLFSGDALWVLSDHAGWWQPWQVQAQGRDVIWHELSAPELDHANAPWQLSEHHHCALADGHWARVQYRAGTGELWLNTGTGGETRVACEYSDFRSLCTRHGRLCCIARSASRLDSIIEVDPYSCETRVLAGGESPLPGRQVAVPETFIIPPQASAEFPVQGFVYLPVGPASDAPPLILMAHGGPTSAVYPVYNAQIQYWCQRGFAVAEVNYRGSSGFGREFRQALAGRWGDIDVQDMRRAAAYLVAQGYADGGRLYIQGRSSGGYTALMALLDDNCFKRGASLFGVTDPLRLRQMTHRFESGYLDWLLGHPDEYPERWQARTPLHHASRIRVPVILFQGGLDPVVVPAQTRAMVDSMTAAGNPPELHWFEDEGHGFRQRRNQANMLEWLHSFYRRPSGKPNDWA
ncbi:prolyl oligopeptidase family serine peptidase [Marinobacter alexandrii]|uniref:alpha/beta hydrolase family protein n=2 Tax=Marinobacter alexandrii TaxID=2570351 RepID=UPI001FFF5B34|nr:prolyl oligopeptidase family serine peptidase [Marinobacter alexandrii]MCK2150700.1 prolyl oligopeptidase family serine peptidase [Marinobacter alexandrii]